MATHGNSGSDLWKICLFGRLELQTNDAEVVRFRTQKSAGLLAYLAYHLTDTHMREHLLERFWPNTDLHLARQNLSTALSSLRRQLEPPGTPAGAVLITDNTVVQLNPQTVCTDVQKFQKAWKAREQDPDNEIGKRQALYAVSLYRGRLLSNLYDDWIRAEQVWLDEQYFRIVRSLLDQFETECAWKDVLKVAAAALRIDPIQEEIQAAYLRALLQTGAKSQAMRRLRELEALWQTETGEVLPLALQQTRQGPLLSPRTRERQIASSVPVAWPARHPAGMITLLAVRSFPGTPSLGPELAQLAPQPLERVPEAHTKIQLADDTCAWLFSRAEDALAAVAILPASLLQGAVVLHIGDTDPTAARPMRAVLEQTLLLLCAGHPGQILCSAEMAAMLYRIHARYNLRLRDLGRWKLDPISEPETVFQIEQQGATIAFPPLQAQRPHQASLPLVMTRFFGRERERERLRLLLQPLSRDSVVPSRSRLITLTGAGGIGKTRLALAVAHDLLEEYRSEIWFVSLAGAMTAEEVVATALQALQLKAQLDTPPLDQTLDQTLDQIVACIGGKPSLLILDNCELLVEKAAAFAGALLQRLPDLVCLATSRVRLALEGETEVRVLALPTSEGATTPQGLSLSPSACLFTNRAQMVIPDFQITDRNAPLIAELCDRLEGIPLALEIAASRIKSLSLSQMRNELAHRLDFLQSSSKRLPARHQTLRATLDWSYALLGEPARLLFARLSVFRGGWDLEAAQAICGLECTALLLEQLVESSLVGGRVSQETEAPLRFTMLEIVREYAATLLSSDEHAILYRRYVEYWSGFVGEVESHAHAVGQDLWIKRATDEQDNLRAALHWTLESSSYELGLRLASDLETYWFRRGIRQEGIQWLKSLLQGAAISCEIIDRGVHASALESLGRLLIYQYRQEEAEPLLQAALALRREIGRPGLIARCLVSLGGVAMNRYRLAEARGWLEEALAIGEKIGKSVGVAGVHSHLGWVAMHSGDLIEAERRFQTSQNLLREFGHLYGVVVTMRQLGVIYRYRCDYERAVQVQQEGLHLDAECGKSEETALLQMGLGHVALDCGDMDQAESKFEEAFRFAEERQYREALAYSRLRLGMVAMHRGQFNRAQDYFDRCLADCETTNVMEIIVRIQIQLADLALLRGDAHRSVAHTVLGLKALYPDSGAGVQIELCLRELGLALSFLRPKQAARICAAAATMRECMGSRIPPRGAQFYADRLTSIQSVLSPAAFQIAWKEGASWSSDVAIQYALTNALQTVPKS